MKNPAFFHLDTMGVYPSYLLVSCHRRPLQHKGPAWGSQHRWLRKGGGKEGEESRDAAAPGATAITAFLSTDLSVAGIVHWRDRVNTFCRLSPQGTKYVRLS